MKFLVLAIPVVIISGLVACSDKIDSSSNKVESAKLVATIQDIMVAQIDPAADALWESVSSTTTAEGTEDKQPRTEEEWSIVRHHAITLAEAANLLVLEGRRVAAEGKLLEDSHVPGVLTADQVQKKIDLDPHRFANIAYEFQDYAKEALVAIDARDTEAFLIAGGKLDQACEKCHQQYWYPDAVNPAKFPPLTTHK
ncbi:hypothetical protein MTYP_02225 [Methylophilaceae bacterium]|nr:hypothetical protein MTYP_02225 [Methylophilaceae bacterium]